MKYKGDGEEKMDEKRKFYFRSSLIPEIGEDTIFGLPLCPGHF